MTSWSDPASDPLQDIKDMIAYLGSEEYQQAHERWLYEETVFWARRNEEAIRKAGYRLTDQGEIVPMQDEHMQEIQDLKPQVDELKVKRTEKEEKKLRRVGDYIKEDEALDPTKMHILGALQNKHVYQGTVFGAEKERRRAKNKRARAARKKNRR